MPHMSGYGKPKKKETLADLLNQIEKANAKEEARKKGSLPPISSLEPQRSQVPALKQAKGMSAADSLMQEELRRRSRFMQKAPKRKVPFQR